MSINIQSWRLYGILHYDPSLTCYLWSLIPTFFWSAPSRRDSMSAAFPDLRPRAMVICGVHRGAFAQQQLRSRDVAVERRPVQRGPTSGVFLREAVGRCGLPAKTTGRRGRCAGEDDGSGGNAELYTRSTDKGRMNVLDSTSSKLFTFTNTLDKFQCIFFTTSLLMNKMYVILIAVSMMMRPVRTMSWIRR